MRRSSRNTRGAAATLGLAVAAVVVAIAARAPVTRSTPVDTRSDQAPTTALFMLLAGVGILMLGALVLVAWPGRRPRDDPPEHQPKPIEVLWIWKVVSFLLAFALGAAIMAAAVIGTRSVLTAPRSGSGASGAVPAHPTPLSGAGDRFAVPAWLPWTLLAMVGIGIAAGVVVLWFRREQPPTEASETDATRAAVQAAITVLDAEPDPRRAVIVAYGAMQHTLGKRGVVHSPAEAPREYLLRALVASRATEQEARTLTGLFEEARYSTHPIPERLRDAALSALRSLRRRLQAEGAK